MCVHAAEAGGGWTVVVRAAPRWEEKEVVWWGRERIVRNEMLKSSGFEMRGEPHCEPAASVEVQTRTRMLPVCC